MGRLSSEIEKLIEEKVESMGVKKYIDEYVREGVRLGIEMAAKLADNAWGKAIYLDPDDIRDLAAPPKGDE